MTCGLCNRPLRSGNTTVCTDCRAFLKEAKDIWHFRPRKRPVMFTGEAYKPDTVRALRLRLRAQRALRRSLKRKYPRPRDLGISPRQLGVSQRQLGISPRQLGVSPRQLGFSVKNYQPRRRVSVAIEGVIVVTIHAWEEK